MELSIRAGRNEVTVTGRGSLYFTLGRLDFYITRDSDWGSMAPTMLHRWESGKGEFDWLLFGCVAVCGQWASRTNQARATDLAGDPGL
jgi:hypothetical protein